MRYWNAMCHCSSHVMVVALFTVQSRLTKSSSLNWFYRLCMQVSLKCCLDGTAYFGSRVCSSSRKRSLQHCGGGGMLPNTGLLFDLLWVNFLDFFVTLLDCVLESTVKKKNSTLGNQDVCWVCLLTTLLDIRARLFYCTACPQQSAYIIKINSTFLQ